MLTQKKKQLLDSWMKNQLVDSSLREDLISNEELRKQSDILLSEFLRAFETSSDIESREYEKVIALLTEISQTRAKLGFSVRATGLYVLSMKKAIMSLLQEEIKNDPKKLFDESQKVNEVIDALSIVTFSSFIKGREEVILRQSDEMAEISTPVIRVWDGIVAMPIIGTLDSARTQVVMENLLREIVNTGSSIAILDISGVPAVDSLVAQHLIKTVAATRLMGAECVISGIRAEIAQTIVHLGIDLSNVQTKATLASALKYAFSLLNIEAKKVDKKIVY
jgi:rsbT co-antagonist protein RsbR